ncbi:MAG: DUF4124 domain-containing protein [Thermomonas sp.]
MYRLAATTCLFVLLTLFAAASHAQANGVYKWKDVRGVTHYSDRPPPAGKFGSVQPNAAARVAAPIQPMAVDPRCSTARNNIARLGSGNADIGLDADGDGKPDAPLPEAQRADQLRMAEAAVRSFCPAVTP